MKRTFLIAAGTVTCLSFTVWLMARSDETQSAATDAETRIATGVKEPVSAVEEQLQEVRARSSGAALRAQLLDILLAAAERDPASAVQLAAQLRDDEGRAEALHECLPLWLRAAPEAARAWLLENVAKLPLELAVAVVRDSAALDPQLALAVAQQLHVGSRPRAIHEVFVEWAGSAPRAAAQATLQLSEADGQLRALGSVARIWAEQEPAEAHTWATQLSDERQRREALLPTTATWAERDPRAAARALVNVPEDSYKQRLIDTVVDQWASVDPMAARSWIERLERPEQRDAAATALLARVVESEPARAASWALQLGHGAQSEIVEKTLTAWLARDSSAALQWAEGQSPEQERGQLLALARQHMPPTAHPMQPAMEQ